MSAITSMAGWMQKGRFDHRRADLISHGDAYLARLNERPAKRAGCGEDAGEDLGANPRTRRRAALAALAAQTRCLAELGGMPVATRKHDSRER